MRCIDGGDHGSRSVGEGARGVGVGGEDAGGVGEHGDELDAHELYFVIRVAACKGIGEQGVGPRLLGDPPDAEYPVRLDVGAVAGSNGAAERSEHTMGVDSGRGEVVRATDIRGLPYFSIAHAILLV